MIFDFWFGFISFRFVHRYNTIFLSYKRKTMAIRVYQRPSPFIVMCWIWTIMRRFSIRWATPTKSTKILASEKMLLQLVPRTLIQVSFSILMLFYLVYVWYLLRYRFGVCFFFLVSTFNWNSMNRFSNINQFSCACWLLKLREFAYFVDFNRPFDISRLFCTALFIIHYCRIMLMIFLSELLFGTMSVSPFLFHFTSGTNSIAS